MVGTWFVVVVVVLYAGLLFAVAFWGDRRADRGRSVINNGTVYALSLAVYATSWTYYGSVGRAATAGLGFLPIYLGPTLMLALGWVVLRRIIRISRRNRITSLADFVSARYGKSAALAGLVTVMAVVGIVPYISLQLKAVSNSFQIIGHPDVMLASEIGTVPPLQDTALYVALLMAGFSILFGTRHLDATERHEGMVAAIALESVVKLVAFLAGGMFVTFGIFGGFGDLFGRAERADLTSLFTLRSQGSFGDWAWLLVLSMLAIVLLPRQWQIGVVENVDERHLNRAMWLFPLYLLIINVFVLPIAAAGLLHFGGTVDADTYVLALPIADGQRALALLVFLGGVSAATGMIIVETIALSTMVSNSLVMPLILGRLPRLADRGDPAKMVLRIRRVAIVAVLLLGYFYFHVTGQGSALASTGLMSFAAVAQFAPALLGGLFWKGGTRKGAITGLVAGMVVWGYTLLLPSFGGVDGWIPASFLSNGPFGIRALRPTELFWLSGMDTISHAMFWSWLVNIGCYVGVSLLSRPDPDERTRAEQFLEDGVSLIKATSWRGQVSVGQLRALLERFLGRTGLRKALDAYPRKQDLEDRPAAARADPDLVHDVEMLLAGSVGAASAHLVLGSVVGQEQLRPAAVIEMIDEASHVAAREERHRLARELHDSVSQALFSMTLHTRAMELEAQKAGLEVQSPVMRSLAQMRSLTQDALGEMRALIFQLRPEALRSDGLTAAVRRHAASVAAQQSQRIIVHAPEARLPLDEWVEEELFRVIQEALHNSVKHADPSRIDIRLSVPPEAPDKTLVIEVADDGTGFDPRVRRTGHLGLSGMQERVEQLGGQLIVDSRVGSTTVRAVLPGILRAAREPKEQR